MNWRKYLWIWPILYFALGMFNIIFAWLGMIDFMLPLIFAIFGGNKYFCNKLCGRGQLFVFLPKKFKCSTGKLAPRWLSSSWFRYGFLVFFMAMFCNVIYQSWLVFGGVRSLRETVKLFWTFNIPFGWAYTLGTVPDWAAQFSFGLYSLMLTSAIIGLIVMVLYRPRTWCTFCPMGTMTQLICKLKAGSDKPLP
ncbi:MAG: 4Fe-4S binding protein [Synergistaceae bacterium]|nr:4Fe-4S binding protein [Synergistaceae bacterium]